MRTFVALLAALALLAAIPATASAATCKLSSKEQRRLGPTYVTSLKVTKISCRSAKRVVRAYHRCRFRSGGKKGRCRSRVSRYRCKERRGGIRTQFSGRVTCKRGRRVIRHTYTQFT